MFTESWVGKKNKVEIEAAPCTWEMKFLTKE